MPRERSIFQTLAARKVPFVVIGGHAVIFHGFVRATEDVDVIWLRSEESERKLLEALTDLSACYIGKEIDPATGIEKLIPISLAYIQAHHLMMLWTAQGFLDLFDYVPGLADLDVRMVFDGSTEVEGVKYASLEMLRQMKTASARDKDLADLKKLDELRESKP